MGHQSIRYVRVKPARARLKSYLTWAVSAAFALGMVNMFADVLTTSRSASKSSSRSRRSAMSGSTSSGRGLNCEIDVMGQNRPPALQKKISKTSTSTPDIQPQLR